MAVTLVRDDDRYLIQDDGKTIGEVLKARYPSDRYRFHGGTGWGKGRTRWVVTSINDEDYPTRKAAVADFLSRRAAS